jgi:hypothetical protein
MAQRNHRRMIRTPLHVPSRLKPLNLTIPSKPFLHDGSGLPVSLNRRVLGSAFAGILATLSRTPRSSDQSPSSLARSRFTCSCFGL